MAYKILRLFTTSLVVLLYGIFPSISSASNLWKEQEIAREIQNNVSSKDIVWLDTGNRQPVLALFVSSHQIKTRGGIILLHDFDLTPNWPRIVQPLRLSLPEEGWHTLSIQTPIPNEQWNAPQSEDIYKETVSRLEAGVAYLQKLNIDNLAVIAHGQIAALAAKYLSENADRFRAFVAISITNDERQEDWRNSILSLKNLNLPLLDIYAEFDVPEVLEFAPQRLIAARISGTQIRQPPPIPHSAKVRQLAKNKTNNLWYRQVMLETAHPGFEQNTELLLKTIKGWLRHYTQRQNQKGNDPENQSAIP